jgi:hypothetical protein
MKLSVVVRVDSLMLFALRRWPRLMGSTIVKSLRKRLLSPIRKGFIGSSLQDAPVVPLQDDVEFQELLRLLRMIKPRNILEIGSYAGGALWHFMNVAERGSHIISIDMLVPPGTPHYPNLETEQRNGHNFLWQRWAMEFGHTFDLIEADSTSAKTVDRVRALMPQIDFLFIDGAHWEEAVRSDFRNYGMISRVVAFHDIVGSENLDVGKVWRELKRNYRTKEFIHPNAGVGIGVLWTTRT